MINKIDLWTDKTSFNSYEDFETYPCAEIKCPYFRNGININMQDLNRNKESHFSNLRKEDDEVLTRIIIDSVPSFTTSSLDYFCPECSAATKVLYDFWAGGRHGEYGFELKYIINKKKE